MGKQVIGFQNLDKMQAIMARNSVVARKADALDLPPTTEIVIPVTLTPAEKRAYEEMKGQLAVQLASGQLATVPNRLAQMMRLRQITAGHLPDDSGTVNVVGDSKAKTISSLVHDTLAGETRIVVFALFTIEIDALTAALAREGTEVMVIRGSTSQEDRRLIRKRFGSDESTRMVLVAQVRTMSLAVNELITANHAIFASLSQMRDDFEQAKARLDRQGQTKPVTFWLALAPKTVDDVIYKSHRDRSDLETAVLQHIQGNG
jgi:SNF2 family DNA or RNA helicase